jgi:hypothetical protein
MPKNETILKELSGLSSYLAEQNINYPFVAPQGYFEAFPSQMLDLAKSVSNNQEPDLLSGVQIASPYHVPEHYFENFAAQVLTRIKDQHPQEELKALSPLLAGLEKKTPFTVPSGYFDEIPGNLTAGIRAVDFVASELEILPPVLADLKGKNVFRVPENYFNELPGEVLKKIKPAAPVIKMNFRKKFIQYAAAAAVVGIIVLSVWFYNNKDTGGMQTNIAAFNLDASLKKVSDAEISNYVESNLSVPLPDPGTVAGNDLDPQDMKALLADISDADLQQYLEKYSIVTDNLTN